MRVSGLRASGSSLIPDFAPPNGMFTRARRYFASDRCEELKSIFLSHYQSDGDRLQTHLRERPGIWLHRETAPLEAVL